jgi:hypothetical protein
MRKVAQFNQMLRNYRTPVSTYDNGLRVKSIRIIKTIIYTYFVQYVLRLYDVTFKEICKNNSRWTFVQVNGI